MHMQPVVKDCYLIMVVMIIAAVDLMVAVPLLTLGLVNSDVDTRRSETPAALNVSCHICNIYTNILRFGDK